MAGSASNGKGVVGQASKPCALDSPMEKINNLFSAFKQSFAYIAEHKGRYSANELARTNKEFENKQDKGHQQHRLTLSDSISFLKHTIVPQDKITKLEGFKVPSAALPVLAGLSYLSEAHATHLNKLLHHPFLQPEVSDPIAHGFAEVEINGIMPTMQARISTHKNTFSQYANLHKVVLEQFLDAVSDYLYKGLLPYWGKVVELLIFQALNTSLAQEKMSLKAAKEKYQSVCKIIESIYNRAYIRNCKACSLIESRNAMQPSPSRNRHKLIKNSMDNLEGSILKPIQNMYVDLSTIIGEIEYSDDANLKEQVMDSLKVYYNIAYGFSIIDLICAFHAIASIYQFSVVINDLSRQKKFFQDIRKLTIQFSNLQLYLADCIEGNPTSLDQVHNKISELIDRTSHLLQ